MSLCILKQPQAPSRQLIFGMHVQMRIHYIEFNYLKTNSYVSSFSYNLPFLINAEYRIQGI